MGEQGPLVVATQAAARPMVTRPVVTQPVPRRAVAETSAEAQRRRRQME
jgi:hypothetical protein